MKILKIFLISFLLLGLTTHKASACACGCGIFNVGTSALIPNCQGGLAFLQYDYANQNRNWHKEKEAPAADNHHHKVKTQTATAGLQYMFNRNWGAELRVPMMQREIALTDHATDAEIAAKNRGIGDVRVNAIYSGFSADMSSGVTFGLKLPTGDDNYSAFSHKDFQLGNGSTDSILGAYHMGKILDDGSWNYFAQTSWQHPLMTRDGYNPGDELAAATGVYYNAGAIAQVKKVATILQFTGTKKFRETGYKSSYKNSGYSQVFIAPGIELSFGQYKVYADVELPIYQNVNGNQLVADRIFKVILGYNF